jgi:CRISPR-associated protein Cst2
MMPDTIQSFVLLDVDVAALNNAGKEKSNTWENAVATKKIIKAGKSYAYVSGQAWRYWWRETLKMNFNWNMSPVTKVDKKNQSFTAANPITYPDDDLFGYMRAEKEDTTDKKTKDKNEDVTLTRVSPLKNSVIIAVSPTYIVKNQSSMTRHEGDSVLYDKDEYCAVMKGMFSIALEQVGTFSAMEKTGFKNLNDSLKKLAMEKGATEINDPFAKDKNGNPLKLYRLPRELRVQRIKDALSALEILNGGAMQTCNMADVTPKLIVLTTLNSGNHLFSHLAKDDLGKPVFSLEALKQVVKDYSDRIKGKVYLGRRLGFMDNLEDKLQEYATQDKDRIFYGSVNEAIREYIKEVETQIP